MTDATPFDMPVIVPAAGQSTRMRGRDKLLTEIDGVPLLLRQLRRARAATTGEILVTLPPAPHPRYACLSVPDVKAIEVPDAHIGLSAGLRRAFAALPAGTAAVLILLPDLPDLTTADLQAVMQAVDPERSATVICGCTEDGKPGHPMVLTSDLFAQMQQIEGDSGAREIRAQEDAAGHMRRVPLPGNHARLDLDTPEAWDAWKAAR